MILRATALSIVLLTCIAKSNAATWNPPGPPEPRVALVIGNSSYEDKNAWPELGQIAPQADQMAHTLQILGFQVSLYHNQKLSSMSDAIHKFMKKIPDGALVWIFYAGHGAEGSLIPVDAHVGDDYDACCIALQDNVLDPLAKARLKAAVVVINACRGIDSSNNSRPDPIPEPGKNTYLTFSTRSGTRAYMESDFVPQLLSSMGQQGEEIESIFRSLYDHANIGPVPYDPAISGVLPDSVYLIPPDAPEQYLDFHEADDFAPDFNSPGHPHSVAAAPFLKDYGITIENITPGTHVGFERPNIFYAGRTETSARLVLMQDDFSPPDKETVCNFVPSVTYTLRFDPPLKEFRFSRVRLLAESESGVTHPAWDAHAFDSQGKEIPQDKPIGEKLIRYVPTAPDHKGAVPEAVFVMNGPYIATVTFTSSGWLNGHPFAAFCSVQISSMGLLRGPTLTRTSDNASSLRSIAWSQQYGNAASAVACPKK